MPFSWMKTAEHGGKCTDLPSPPAPLLPAGVPVLSVRLSVCLGCEQFPLSLAPQARPFFF